MPTPPDITPSPVPPSPIPEPTLPPVVGPEPSYKVAVFYYPWYRTQELDGYWDHWGGGIVYTPPQNITSDYYPELGVYSIADPAVLSQHFAWLREAGVGIIVSSWWGQGSREDQAVGLLLDIADQYGIKVAFHIENPDGRTANRIVSDIQYIYRRYGDHPAFFRTTQSSRWNPDDRPKGLFYLWASIAPDGHSASVEPGYWQDALDRIHALPDGAIVLTDQTRPDWVYEGHFDGMYNYAVLDKYKQDAYAWARSVPPDAWYVPCVLPGSSANRIGYPADENTPRRDGATYGDRWEAALSQDVEPTLVTITSFNEWHEGTQIEPAAVGETDGKGYTYKDYGALPPDGYLTLTRQWVDHLLAMTWPETTPLRIRMTTTSDWTDFRLLSGATWLRPEVISVSEEATQAVVEGDHFSLTQSLARGEAGESVEMVVDIMFTGWESPGTIEFEIDRGNLGVTRVELFRLVDGEPVTVQTLEWGGITGAGRNARAFQISADTLFGLMP